jgi:hypothetical protein
MSLCGDFVSLCEDNFASGRLRSALQHHNLPHGMLLALWSGVRRDEKEGAAAV